MAAIPDGAVSRSTPYDLPLRVSARTDYAIRALTELAASGGEPITAQRISLAQAIPLRFLLNILADLRRAGLVRSHRGRAPGYVLTRPPAVVTLADVIRIMEGDLSRVHEVSPEGVSYPGAADIAAARSRGVNPGELVMIHGTKNGLSPNAKERLPADWTDGCIAVTDEEMDEIWRAVPDNTKIVITP